MPNLTHKLLASQSIIIFYLIYLAINSQIKYLENKDNQKLETLRQHDKTSYDAVLWLKDNKQKFKAIVYEPIMTQVNNFHY